ncbi:signal transduction histidine kinase [Flavobacterium nitrogenifigens]|uniref:Signal transduction histidine kinase n=2 Tax=Flavobacterium TaxID=237 RepID=A0A7W7IYY5_9FLAO|nr:MULTISPECIES: DUF2809 domain-containing protein [Flavobacterium]MBB4803174.1 signal transduction histidine kinase [Flavobacterium nitrogenifigens]MBB6388132.1 signal transduction histidine kinase [Flavobacterium notoginsengisoli]
MKKTRIYYTLIFFSIIFLGILSRKISFIPLWIGDFLYAVMIYFLIRIFLPFKKASIIFLLSLITCYSIEFLQLYQGEWMVELRKTLFGRYVLGQGFLWSDIIAYTFGIITAFIVERFTLRFLNQKSE